MGLKEEERETRKKNCIARRISVKQQETKCYNKKQNSTVNSLKKFSDKNSTYSNDEATISCELFRELFDREASNYLRRQDTHIMSRKLSRTNTRTKTRGKLETRGRIRIFMVLENIGRCDFSSKSMEKY